ncbi:hypothetical protein [Saccharicrinis sp. 156]|uniref:hypothetical protein n=1 Tax=Saccharicrinis sp. 156 TaxID=3417574 RepID=UPI003D35926B
MQGTLVLLSLMIFGCQEDFVEPNPVVSDLKNATVTVPMNGMIKGAEYETELPGTGNPLPIKV